MSLEKDEKSGSVKLNYVYSVLYQILASILPLVTSPYIARTIGAEGLGIYSYYYSIAHYFAIFILLGLSNYGNRAIASVRADKEKMSKTFWEIYTMQVLLATVVIIGYVLFLGIFSSSDLNIRLLMVLYLLSSAIDINWFFNGIEQFKLTVIRNSLIKIGTVVCIFVFVHTADDVWKYTLIMVAGFLISQMSLWPYVPKYIKFVKPNLKNVFNHIKPNLVLFIPVIAINVYKYMDKIMLGAMIDKVQVGYYENAEKVILIPMGFITAFGNVMLPKMSNMYATGNGDEAKEKLSISFKFVTTLTTAMAFGLAAVATKFSIIFWGKSFAVCGMLISILSISMIFISWPNIIRTQYLIPTHNEKHYIISVIIGALVNFGANYVLIKKYQAVGTAVGTVFAEMSVCIYQIGAVWKALKMKKVLWSNVWIVLPGFIMYICVRMIDMKTSIGIVALVCEILVGVVVFVGSFLTCGFLVDREETRLMVKYFSKKGRC